MLGKPSGMPFWRTSTLVVPQSVAAPCNTALLAFLFCIVACDTNPRFGLTNKIRVAVERAVIKQQINTNSVLEKPSWGVH